MERRGFAPACWGLFSTTEFRSIRNRLIAGLEYQHLRIAPIYFTGRTLDDVLELSDGSEISVVGRVLFPANDENFDFLSESSLQTTASAFVQDEQQLGDKFKAVVGGRFDRNNQFGNVFNIRSGLRYSPWTALAGRVSYNEAFISPSLFDLSSSLGELKPMRLRTGEVGLQAVIAEKMALQLVGFCNYFSDKIVTDDVYVRINRGSETTLGTEAEFRWYAGSLSGYVGLSYIQKRDGSTPLDAAALKVNGRLSWNAWKNLFLSMESKYTSPITTNREDPSNPEMTMQYRIDRYKLVNLTLTAKEVALSPTSNLTISATLRNVFDFENHFPNHRGVTPYTFLEEPRSIYVKAEIDL